ncbi:O-antigen ligase family protein [bacterium]|nr:O-antigen ligase family protein [bacterium]
MNGKNRMEFVFLALSSGVFFVLPPFLLGGVYSHTGTNLAIMFVCALSTFCYSVYLIAAKKSFAVSSAVIPLAAIILFALLQLIPLPSFMLKILSPQGYFFHALEGSGARPLTMSVPDTLYSVFRIITLIFLACILSSNIFSDDKKWKQNAIDTVILVSTAVFFVSVAMRFMHTDSWLYGKLRHGGFLMDSILINTNHAAGYFGISGLLALISAYTANLQRKKTLYAALFFLHSVAVAATLSRAGIAAYVAALILFFITNGNYLKKREGHRFYLPLAAIILTLILVYQTGLKLFENEFDISRESYFSKLDNIARAKEYFGDFFLTGSGLGSFPKVFSYYNPNPEILATQLENEPVQFILETGLFFALTVFSGFIALIFSGQRGTKRKSGLATVLFFVVLHNTLDFNLHNFATLFPVVLVLVILVKPIELSGNRRTAVLLSIALLSLVTMLFTAVPGGRKLLGYSPEEPYPYEKAVFFYPADYTIPMKTAIEKVNSTDGEVFASAGREISVTISKSPKYYYGYYLNGVYLLHLGAAEAALNFFKQALTLCPQKKYPKFLNKIYDRLRLYGLQGRITEILSPDEKRKAELEKFIFKISPDNPAVLDFAVRHQDIFFISVIKNMLAEKQYDEALNVIDKISAENKNLSNFERGKLLVYRGKIAEHNKLYQDAFQFYMRGAGLTQNFDDYLTAAYCSLKLDPEAQNSADTILKNTALKTSGNLGKYYRWLSRREFNAKNSALGFKYLERAAEVAKNPYWQLEVANTYAKRGMHYPASQIFLKIIREYPKFRPEEMKKRYEAEKLKTEKDEEKNFKELMLRKKK